jgi:ABC-type amino acid transport substrate-binding protein
VPDGDLFKQIRQGKVSVETGQIARFETDGISLQDGRFLQADIVVVATGLQLNVLADVAIYVDGHAFVAGDALAYKGITPARLASIDFSEPIMISGGATFTRPGLLPSADLRQFDGMRVVTTRHGPLWRHLQTEHPALQLLPAEHYQQALEMVLRGEADLAALNMHAGRAIAQRLFPGQLGLPQLPYMPLRTGFALRRGAHPELLLRFNAALAAARADGRWQAVHDHWVR